MLNCLQRLTIVAMGIFLSSAILPSFSLTSPYYSIVYAAVISCGPWTADPRWNPCNGTNGDDIMKGDAGENHMNGFEGNDRLDGGPAYDYLHGGWGNDQVNGGPGDDHFLIGSLGADSFKCGTGNDRIADFNPSEGDTKSNDCERIVYGNNTLTSGLGNDSLVGFPGNDTFTSNSSRQ